MWYISQDEMKTTLSPLCTHWRRTFLNTFENVFGRWTVYRTTWRSFHFTFHFSTNCQYCWSYSVSQGNTNLAYEWSNQTVLFISNTVLGALQTFSSLEFHWNAFLYYFSFHWQKHSTAVVGRGGGENKEVNAFWKSLVCFSPSALQSDMVVMVKYPHAAVWDGATHPHSTITVPVPSFHSPHTLSLSLSLSHWSCKLCLRCVYAPFLPKLLLSLTNYSRINYKPFTDTDSQAIKSGKEKKKDMLFTLKFTHILG